MTKRSIVTAGYKEGGTGRTKAQKRLLFFRRQRGTCAICLRRMSMADATLDHIVPRAFGGTDRYTNLRAAHRSCNMERGASMDDVFVHAAGLIALRWNVKELP